MADPMLQAGAAALRNAPSTDAALSALLPGGVWAVRAPVDVEEDPLVVFKPNAWAHRLHLRRSLPARIRPPGDDAYKGEDDAPVLLAGDRVYSLLQDPDDVALPMVRLRRAILPEADAEPDIARP